MRARAIRATALSLALVATSASPTLAASCDPGRSSVVETNWAGSEETDYPGVTGIRADVWESDVWVDWTTNVPTSAWVMLNAGPGQLAQVGWLEQAFNNRKVFIQYRTDSGSYPLLLYSPKAEDQFTTYTVNYRNSADNFKFFVDGALYHEAAASFNPSKSQVMGETKNRNNQMPGIYGARQLFYDAERRNADEVTWVHFFGNNWGTTNNNWFSYVDVGSNDSQIWDDC